MNILKSNKSLLINSGVFAGTIFTALIGSYTEITILNFFITTFLFVALAMLVVRRLEVVRVSLVNWILIGLTILFVLLFVPIAQYIYLGYFMTYEVLFLIPLLLNVLLSFLCSLVVSIFIK